MPRDLKQAASINYRRIDVVDAALLDVVNQSQGRPSFLDCYADFLAGQSHPLEAYVELAQSLLGRDRARVAALRPKAAR